MLLEPVYKRDFLRPLLWLPALLIGRSSPPGNPERHDGLGLRLVNAIGITKYNNTINLRFTLSYRDVEELLAQRGPDVSYETIWRWVLKFGPAFARRLRRRRPRPSSRWHLDEMVVRIGGKRMYLWRAVDDEGEVLDVLVQRRQNKAAARKLTRKLLKKQGFAPSVVVTDKLRSYSSAFNWDFPCGALPGR